MCAETPKRRRSLYLARRILDIHKETRVIVLPLEERSQAGEELRRVERDNPKIFFSATTKLNVKPEDSDEVLKDLINARTIPEKTEYQDLFAKSTVPAFRGRRTF